MIRTLLALLILCATAFPASAHRLKVFVTIEGDTIRGYAFFVGGGRAALVPWSARDAAGGAIAAGNTDAQGGFAFAAPQPPVSDVTVTVDTREGHVASATLAAARLGGTATAAVPDPATARGGAAAPASLSADAAAQADRHLAATVEAAVQRQVAPLLERLEEMDSRLRFADVLSGVFLILGLAGAALWARGRRT
jgi:nickel transport protein